MISENNSDLYVKTLVANTREAIHRAEQGDSKLTPEILALGGMSSAKVRHLLNNLCESPGARYLEVGTYAGSTFVSALFRNSFTTTAALGIDNYSQFGGFETFKTVTENYLIPGTFSFLKEDFRKVDLAKEQPGTNVYFYDGGHSIEDHRDAITHFWDSLADVFVLVIDDWLEPEVRIGTQEAFNEILNGDSFVIRETWELPSRGNGDTEQWWNGVLVAVIQKFKR